ncbi:MAG TPA: type 4a pilus biogenesis protein PilO [Burkholderiales bacterium]|nr:type 4a pilus biogenesis protein PilO [Burkholderiales bacterium]
MTLDDLKALDPNNIGNWPVVPKLGLLVIALVLIVFAGYWFDWQGQLDDLEKAQAKEEQLRNTFLDKKRQAVNLEIYKKQLAEIELSFGTLLKQLPNKSEMDALLTDINQAGLGRGLQFELFRPDAHENVKEFYAELPIHIRITGNYHELGAFASDIAKMPRIVTLSDININPVKDSELAMDAVAKTYRYLDEDEIAKQKQAAKSKRP